VSLTKGRKRRSRGSKPLVLAAAGVAGAVGLAAILRKRGQGDDLGYGPPNESHPSHETLAPAQAAAGAENPG
jgi:hypothetical protein